MRRHRVRVLLLLSLLVGVIPMASAASYTFTPIDVPGSLHTQAYGINDDGQIVGSYSDTQRGHGFLLAQGVFIPIDGPDNTVTIQAQGINKLDDIVGVYNAGAPYGFLWVNGVFTTIAVPGSTDTYAYGINKDGDIVGLYRDATSGRFHVFVRSDDDFTALDVPPGGSGSGIVDFLGINDHNEIVGGYPDPTVGGRNRGFLLSKGVFTPIDVPGSAATSAFGINKQGDIVGTYTDASTGQGQGFVLSKGTFTSITVPGSFGAISTAAYGINAAGQVVGLYARADNTQHGFLATPTKK